MQTEPKPARRGYPSDVSDEEWAFVQPYLCLMTPDAPQRQHDLREVFNALRWMVKSGSPWRYLPGDFPPWWTVYQQTQRWIQAGVFEEMVDDLRELLRVALGKQKTPSAVIVDSQTLRSTPESGHRAGYDAGKKTKGTKVHVAVDTLGCLLSIVVTPASAQDRDAVGQLCQDVQDVTCDRVKKAYADGGYTGPNAQAAAAQHGIEVEVVKLPDVVRGFVVLPKRWIVERSFAWKTRFRRLVRDYERLPETVAGLHFAVFAGLMLARLVSERLAAAMTASA